MASGSGGPGGPKILLAKPAGARAAEGSGSGGGGGPTGIKLMRDRDDDHHHGAGRRITQGSLNLLSDSWDLAPDRYLPVSIFFSSGSSVFSSKFF